MSQPAGQTEHDMTSTASQAADILNVSLSTVYRRCRAGHLNAVKVDRRWAITLTPVKPAVVSDFEIEHRPAGFRTFSRKPYPATWEIVHRFTEQGHGRFDTLAGAEARKSELDANPPARLAKNGTGYTMEASMYDTRRYDTQLWDRS